MNETNLTGKPSVDKPWLALYPKVKHNMKISYASIADYLKQSNYDHNQDILDYYGCRMNLNNIFDQVDKAAKSLKAIGVKEGDCVVSFLQSTPTFIILLLATEQIGAQILCRDGDIKECFEAIFKEQAKIVFTHDYLSQEEADFYYSSKTLKHIILVSPYTYADQSQIPFHIKDNIEYRYPLDLACNAGNVSWEEFMRQGENYLGEYHYPADFSRPLYKTYTCGSTGPSKQVIHSAKTVVGAIEPMTVLTPRLNFEFSSLLAILPPAFIAVVGPMLLYRLATNSLLILDPFCDIEDVDLEVMRYKPNGWNAIPQLTKVLINSKRMPEDYSLQFLYQIGGGGDPINNKQLDRIQKFLKKHKSPAIYTVEYAMSEAGSVITGTVIPFSGTQNNSGSCGVPILGVTVGIFEDGGHRELGYREIGEICTIGAGNMIGYDNQESTLDVLQMHPDGRTWLHTGDYGYMSELGEVFILSRGLHQRFGGGCLFPIIMENCIVGVPGVEDGFFVLVKDRDHEGYSEPYLYLILEEGATLEEVKKSVLERLQPYEYPVKISVIKERKYYHFKTNRRELAEQIMREYEDEKKEGTINFQLS